MSEVKYVVDGYETMLNELKQENQKLQRRIDVFERAKRIWERRSSGEYSDLNDASQEAAHYYWLDEQNEKLTEALKISIEALTSINVDDSIIQNKWVTSYDLRNDAHQALSKLKSLGITKEGE